MNRALLLLAFAPWVAAPLAAAEPGAAAPAAPARPRDNPPQADPALELLRLRAEGAANYEGGISLKKAAQRFEAALALRPDSPVEQFNLAVVKRKLGDVEGARALLASALQADPRLAQAWFLLGMIDKAEGKRAAALAEVEKARDLAPNDPDAHFQAGFIAKESGAEAVALQEFVKVLAMVPQHQGALYQMYQYYQQQGDATKAEIAFKEFSRVKRAIAASRKGADYEEGALARPIALPDEERANQTDRSRLGLAFSLQRVEVPEKVVAVDVRDLSGSGKPRLVAALQGGGAALIERTAGGEFARTLVQAPSAARGAAAPSWTSVLGAEQLARAMPWTLVGSLGGGIEVAALEGASARAGRHRLGDAADRPLLLFDADRDGDLDILDQTGSRVWINEGDGNFRPAASFLDPGRASPEGAIAAGFSGGDGIDLLLFWKDGERRILRDQLAGRFAKAEPLPAVPGLLIELAADLDNDGKPDLLSLTREAMVVELGDGRGFRRAFERKLPGAPAAAVLADVDNDGLEDLVVVFEDGSASLFLNDGRGRLSAPTALPGKLAGKLQGPLVAADLDGDGRVDVIGADARGIFQWRNQSTGVGNWVTLSLFGLRSAPSGTSTQVEARAGGLYRKVESSGRPVHIGIGRMDHVEVLRFKWPNGFVESKFNVGSNTTWVFKESERVSGSCPSVFAWDGSHFGYVTDAFISGPMGVPMGPGQYFPVDHDEYLKLSGEKLVEKDGRLAVRLTEELREVVYLDHARLLAIDHPAEISVHPNEKIGPFPFPEFRILGTANAQPPLSAVDQDGHDVLDLIRSADGRHARDVHRTADAGFAEPHGITFELPAGAAASPWLRIFLTGWFYYFESTSIVASGQRPATRMIWPELQVETGSGWTTLAVAGLPPGKHKTIMVDLSGKLPAGARRLRVWSNVAIYWDAIQIDASAPPADGEYRVQTAPLADARLSFRGFSGRLPGADESEPEAFDYDTIGYSAPWNPLKGRYTRYGAVGDLLAKVDSRLVVFGSGDELALEFDAGALRAPPAGWERDYFLYLDGYVKDGDRYTANPGRVDPMPWAGIRQYPYDPRSVASLFASAEYVRYLREYQTREPLGFFGPDLANAEIKPVLAGGSR
ncbi:MAG TPA: FG-GAP-like repeat-containing protein [Myxococcales bacterium]